MEIDVRTTAMRERDGAQLQNITWKKAGWGVSVDGKLDITWEMAEDDHEQILRVGSSGDSNLARFLLKLCGLAETDAEAPKSGPSWEESSEFGPRETLSPKLHHFPSQHLFACKMAP